MADITLTAADGHTLSAYRSDAAAPIGGVVVVQEIFGVNAHIRSVVDRLVAAGFSAIAPALFDRSEVGVELPYDLDGMTKGRGIAWGELSIDDAVADVTAAADALAADVGGAARVGAVGFCYGGMVACATGSRAADHLGAVVAYYPSQSAKVLADDQVQRPLMIHVGDQDQGIPSTDVDTLAVRWPHAEVHRYAGADHGFNCDLRSSFNPEASAQAWERTIAFLTAHIGPGPEA